MVLQILLRPPAALLRQVVLLSSLRTNELLMGITPESEIDTVFLLKTFITNYTAPKGTFQQPEPIQEEGTEDVLNLVKTLFNLREYKKCSYVLEPFMKNRPSHSVIFFYYYSKWMSYQIRKEEEIYENGKKRVTQRGNPGRR